MGTNKEHAVQLAQWESLLTSIAANAADLPQLELARTDLQKKLEEIQALRTLQGVHQAAKQDAVKKIAATIKEGKQLAVFLRTGVRQRFGKESEKLIEFGVPPFRGRRRTSATPPSESPVPATGAAHGTSPA